MFCNMETQMVYKCKHYSQNDKLVTLRGWDQVGVGRKGSNKSLSKNHHEVLHFYLLYVYFLVCWLLETANYPKKVSMNADFDNCTSQRSKITCAKIELNLI